MSSATPAEPQAALRQRRVEQRSSSDETIIHTPEETRDDKRDEVVWGKTPGGEGTSWHTSLETTRDPGPLCEDVGVAQGNRRERKETWPAFITQAEHADAPGMSLRSTGRGELRHLYVCRKARAASASANICSPFVCPVH